ncbi:MAG TPA: type 4a pilus biogenesis protein PilO [Phycisphaerae bacterium]|nr:type 4a pilus biogenesis protein PilO [Phycisphaerae bacterium]HRY69882.1 type 4a pilus biogenesis protein PilO [Phycisphaerae bacterium]HSA25391.1 type 4a pilus biogenesis protein PilO [Phycisphaerae bacterium]
MRRIALLIDRRSVLWAAGIVVATAAFLGTVTAGQIRQMAALKAVIEARQNNLTAGTCDSRAIAQLQQTLDQLALDNPALEEEIPREANLDRLLQTLERFADTRGLRPDLIQPGEPLVFPEATALPITMRVRGRFPAVFALVKDIQSMSRLTRFERFSANRLPPPTKEAEASPSAEMVTAELKFRVFYNPV